MSLRTSLGVSLFVAWIGFVLIANRDLFHIVASGIAGWQMGGWAGQLMTHDMRKRTDALRKSRPFTYRD